MTGWQLPDLVTAPPAQWEARLRGLARAFDGFAAQAKAVAAAAHGSAAQARAARHVEADREFAATVTKINNALDQVTRAAVADINRLLASIAPGPAGQDWPDLAYSGSAVPQAVRMGTVNTTRGKPIPMVLPLLDRPGWWLDGAPDAVQALIRAVVLRLVAAAPAGKLRVDGYDPALTGAPGVFATLSERAPDLMPAALREPGEIQACLAELGQVVADRGARMSELGVAGFEQLQARLSRQPEPFRLVVLHNYPAGFDGAGQRQLLRLVDSAAGRGVSFLVHHDPLVEPRHDVDPDELQDRLWELTHQDGHWRVAGFDGVRVSADPPPDERLCAAIGTVAGDAAARAALPTVGLDEILPARWLWWAPAGRSLVTDIGIDDRGPATLEMSSSDPAKPNVLIGGSVGSGKSNLLQVMIHTLAVRYSPRDLQMYLLDFKQGIEFAALGPGPTRPHFLPHARVLGVYSDREFGLAVLQDLAAELESRSAEFKRWGCTDIAKPPAGMDVPPRLLVVLDEFQVMLADDDEISVEAAARLEHLVRQGRAYGIHVVLATQSLDGITRLAAKRDAILGQIHHRIVLKTTPVESQSMLRLHNTAAARLRFRGQAVFNDDLGEPQSNKLIQIAYAERTALDALRRQLWRLDPSCRPPRIFEQGEAADLGLALAAAGDLGPAPDGSTQGWAGLPIKVTERPEPVPVLPEPGAGLLILGEDESMAVGSLTAMAVPLAVAGRGRGDRFILFDLLSPASAEHRDALVTLLRRLGAEIEVVRRAEFGTRLAALKRESDQRSHEATPVHVLGAGLHRALRFDPDDLRDLIRHGPAHNVFLYGWWNRLAVCTSQLGYDRCGVNQYLFLRHPLDGVREVCGFVNWEPRPQRALYYNGIAAEPSSLVTFAPLTDTGVASIVQRLA